MLINIFSEFSSNNHSHTDCITIFLHGYGDCGENFEWIGRYFAKKVNNRIIVVPNAIKKLQFGYSWFDIHDFHSNINNEIIGNRAIELDSIISNFINNLTEKYKCNKVEIIGFSQGAILSLRSIFHSRYIYKIVAGSGVLFNKEGDILLSRSAKIVITHGTRDSIVPFCCLEITKNRLKGFSIDATCIVGDYDHNVDGLIYEIDNWS